MLLTTFLIQEQNEGLSFFHFHFLTSISAATQVFSKSTKAKTSPLTSDFEKAVTLALNNRHVAGLSVAVIDGNEIFSEVTLPTCLSIFNVDPLRVME